MTLALCLFVRFSRDSRCQVGSDEAGWVLCLSTLLAYKVSFDGRLEGILEYYAGLMGLAGDRLVELERAFLAEIDYNTVVRSYEFHVVLSRLLAA